MTVSITDVLESICIGICILQIPVTAIPLIVKAMHRRRDTRGYFIEAQGKLTPTMTKGLQEDSLRWGKMKNEAKKFEEGITITRSDAITSVNLIQQTPATSQPPHWHFHDDEESSQDNTGVCPREVNNEHKRIVHKISLRPDHPNLRHDPITQNPYATTSPNTGSASSPAFLAITGAINIAANSQAKVNSGVEASNTTAAWIFGAVAPVTNGVMAFATRQTAKASKRSAKAAEETCLIAQKHLEATIKDNKDRLPSPDTSQNVSGAGVVASSGKEQKSDTRSRTVVTQGTGTKASPLNAPRAVLSPGLPEPSGRGRVLRTMSNPTPGRREENYVSLDLPTAKAEPTIIWPEVPTCEFGKPCNCKIIPKY